ATSQRVRWMTFLDYSDWASGRMGNVVIAIGLDMTDVYERISATPLTQIGNYSFGQLLLILLTVVGVMFVVIQSVAYVMGLKLARSITGAVHELASGTEHVRRGDFSHRISVNSHDQLGDLADSFNSMTASVEGLLHAKAEKERLEQELRIARQIQMSLLPQGPLRLEGLCVTAHCEPAREVGGDYYDYFTLGDKRVGIIIADVAGKGTSAALYLAELTGLLLSLSLLEQVTIPLGVGDVVLLFTDGVTEAMNADGEPFGEERLAALVSEHGELPFEELRERILREIRAFVGNTGLHDDLTLVLLKVE